MIYLDNAATSWPKPEKVYETMDSFMRKIGANPSRGGHKLSIESGKIIMRTREKLAKLFNIEDSRQIIFTLNATDSINMVIKGLLKYGDHVVTTSLEHNSVIRPLQGMKGKGIELEVVSPEKDGIVDIEKIKGAIRDNTRLVVITHASNVIGTIQPLKELGTTLKNNSYVKLLVDAAQTAGILPIDVLEHGIDFLAFSGHKGLLGPQGVGGLYISKGNELLRWREGGTGSKSESKYQPEELPDKLESGTPNTPGIAGLEAGIDYINERGIENILEKKRELLEMLIDGLEKISNVEIYGSGKAGEMVPVVALNIGKESSQEISFALDQAFSIVSRGGLHCAPMLHENFGNRERGAVRLSIGAFNSASEIEQTLHSIEKISEKIR